MPSSVGRTNIESMDDKPITGRIFKHKAKHVIKDTRERQPLRPGRALWIEVWIIYTTAVQYNEVVGNDNDYARLGCDEYFQQCVLWR